MKYPIYMNIYQWPKWRNIPQAYHHLQNICDYSLKEKDVWDHQLYFEMFIIFICWSEYLIKLIIR